MSSADAASSGTAAGDDAAAAVIVSSTASKSERIPGIASIKPEYVIRPIGDWRGPSKRDLEAATAAAAAAGSSDTLTATDPASTADAHTVGTKRTHSAAAVVPLQSDAFDDDAAENASGGKKQKRERGQNKGRKFAKQDDEVRMCNSFMRGVCAFGKSCKFSHDLETYMRSKEADLTFLPLPSSSSQSAESLHALKDEGAKQAYLDTHYSTSEPFLISTYSNAHRGSWQKDDSNSAVLPGSSTDTGVRCPIFDRLGECGAGWKCRFLGGHVRIHPDKAENGQEQQGEEEEVAPLARMGNVELLGLPGSGHAQDEDHRRGETNYVSKTALRELKSRRYPLPKTKAVMAIINSESEQLAQTSERARVQPIVITEDGSAVLAGSLPKATPVMGKRKAATEADLEDALMNGIEPEPEVEADHSTQQDGASIAIDRARVRPTEKRRLDWKGKLYLAPLTTTGNLPFRRLCASFGSDIHCGEMGLAESYLNGQGGEWSLVRRWEGERIFGTQICGSKPQLLLPAVEALVNEVGSGLDFVDLNCGCPIDLVYNRGAGSALLDHAGRLGKILRGVNAVLGEIPLTIKLRTGTTSKNTTHKLFARLQTKWGCSAVTLHGRSRKQRYKNLADWDYIKTCADTLRSSVQSWNEESRHADEVEMVPIPVFGNGDVYSWEDYRDNMARTGVDGEMVARGALIKPWVFTEIKDQRTWDISSRERLDMYRQFAENAISHWGSDTQGVNTARRFFCEMLSFTHRYIPAGILEHLPPRLNDRPPIFRGRDELETLLASSKASDWVRVSDMFFGKAPESWHFTPKHKSNAYDADGGAEQQG